MSAGTEAALAPGRTIPNSPTFGAATTGKVGMWIFLVTDAMTFGGLLLAYGILRIGNTNGRRRRASSAFPSPQS